MSIPIISGRRDPLVKVAPHIFRIDLPVAEVQKTDKRKDPHQDLF